MPVCNGGIERNLASWHGILLKVSLFPIEKHYLASSKPTKPDAARVSAIWPAAVRNMRVKGKKRPLKTGKPQKMPILVHVSYPCY
jgi:hypothetical protein